MKYFLLILNFLIINGCDNNGTKNITEIIVDKTIFKDCNLWVEKNVLETNYIRVGYSGACSSLSIVSYSKELSIVFENYDINKNNYPNVNMIYINSYRTDGKLNDELRKLVNKSSDWDIASENCNSEVLSNEFKSFNSNERYLALIEDIIVLNFYIINDVSFEGVQPYRVLDDKSTCYPDSFGVAVYTIKKS